MNRASIDIGSNSILLQLGKVEGGQYVPGETYSRVTGLGRGIDQTHAFIPEAMRDSREVLTEYVSILERNNTSLSQVVVTATEASRVATNSGEFFRDLARELGLHFTIISGEGEAYLSALAAHIGDGSPGAMGMMDIGGASTEIAIVHSPPFCVDYSVSLKLGSVRAMGWIEHNAFDEHFGHALSALDKSKISRNRMICVAGTMTSLANMLLGHKDFQEKEVHGYEVSLVRLNQLRDQIQNWSEEQLLREFPFLGKRARVLKGGLRVACSILRELNLSSVFTSTRGLRDATCALGCVPEEFVVGRITPETE